MKLGIKVGPQHQSFLDIAETQTPFVEVWFNILQKDVYRDLFREFKKRRIESGLHFWGHLQDHTWANIAIPDSSVVKQSMALIKETIDIAAREGCSYVNIHPSTRARVSIKFETETFTVLNEPAAPEKSEDIFFENLTILNTYAKNTGVTLTIETIPSRDTNGWRNSENRKHPFDLYSLDNSVVVKAATRGFTIANDFGHTACTVRSENRSAIWDNLKKMTHTLAPQTRLLHLGYLIPPYNGTDFHDHLDNPVFTSQDAIPNKLEMLELLQPFIARDDIWALVEPDGRHAENYFFMKAMIEAASVRY